MTAALAVVAEMDTQPAIAVFRFPDGAALRADDAGGCIVAYLRDRELRLFATAYCHALDARVLGGMSSTIELIDFGPDLPVHCAAAARLSADSHGVHLALLDRAGRVLVRAPFDDRAFARLTGDPDP